MITKRTDPTTGEPVENAASLQKAKDKDVEGKALIMRKYINDVEEENDSEIDIIDSSLWDLLKENLAHHPYHIFRGSPVALFSPYEALVFNYDALRLEASKTQDPEKQLARDDLTRLLDIISGGSSGDEKLDKYFKNRDGYKDRSTIQFEDLWTVFPPGTLVYGNPFQNEHQVFVVKDNHKPWPWRDERPRGSKEWASWKLEAWSYDWKDGLFRRTPFTLLFDEFEGPLPLTSLPYYPFRLHQQYDDVFRELVSRGKLFRGICEAKQSDRLFSYEGKIILEKKGFLGMRPDEEVSAL